MSEVRAVAQLVERVLAEDGPLPAYCEEQRKLAGIVAKALDAPPKEGAFVTLTQAATGTGKTIALLTPLMALAALQKKQEVQSNRAALSTFSNHLTRQILEEDAPKVSNALEALGYSTLRVATRVGRRQFIDRDRVDGAIKELQTQPNNQDSSAFRSLEQLCKFATFAEAEDHQTFVPAGFSQDDLCLTPRSAKAASKAFMAAKQAAADADLVFTNHALALADCRYRGGLLGTGDRIPTVVFDEADALPGVARSLADERIGLKLIEDLVAAAAIGADAVGTCRELLRLCGGETARGRHRLLANCASKPRIIALIGKICSALSEASFPDDDLAEEAQLLQARLKYFLDSAESGKAVAALSAGASPALAVVHREPVRLLRHVFEKAGAAFFVSATLAAPSENPNPNDLLRAFGIAPGMKTPAKINYEAWGNLEPRQYGRMQFRFADRSVPSPFIREVDDSADAQADPEHLRYVVSAIEEARKSGRVLVLCTSYKLAEEIGACVKSSIVHARGTLLRTCLDEFRAAPVPNAVLLTPAAWAGVSASGAVDHIVIPRIPFRPRSVEDESKRSFLSQLGFASGKIEGLIAGDRNAAARRKLAQGIGRGIRGPSESCTLWLLDPRFPLPKSMTREIGGPGQGKAVHHLQFINCIPPRFRNGRNPDIGKGQIWPPKSS